MDYRNLIQDFVDGGLDKPQEEELFMALSSNDELRNDLRQSIRIDKSFYRKLSSFNPSVNATAGIFSQLGFETPESIVPKDSRGTTKKGFFRKNSQGLRWGLISSLLTAALFLLFLIPEFDGGMEKSALWISQSEELAINIGSSNLNSNYADESELKNFDNETALGRSYRRVASRGNSLNGSVSDSRPQADKIDEQPVADTETDEKVNDVTDNTINLEENNDNENPKVQVPIDEETDMQEKIILTDNFETPQMQMPGEKLGLSVSLKGSHFWNSAKAEKILTTTSELHNIGIAAYYRTSSNFSWVAEVQNEKFYQEYEIEDEYGNRYEYMQYPSYTNIQAGFKYDFLNKEYFNTFVQVMAGGVQTGATGSLMLGVEFKPHTDYSFIFSFEGSSIAYFTGGKGYLTPKFGVNYGIAVNL